MITVIYGPPASGKTTNAEAFMSKFGCDRVLDRRPDYVLLPQVRDGDLLLTQLDPEAIREHLPSARILEVGHAKRLCGIKFGHD
jgi:hypothetical protein